MKSKFFDVVVVGARFGALVAGALLARRGFRVLVLGQSHRPPEYEVAGVRLPRSPFNFLATHSPVARRTFSELALQPLFRRHARAVDPSLQIALPGHRFDLALDRDDLLREVDREFPEVRRPVEDFHHMVDTTWAQFDRLLERDLMWPPETFLERREFARASAHQPFDRAGNGRDPLGELPEDHPFRTAVRAPVALATAEDPQHASFLSMMRLYGAWMRGVATVDGDYAWLEQALFSRIEAHSGLIRTRERVERILLHRNAPHGVRLAGSGEEIGCSFIVAGCDLASLLQLVPDRTPFEGLFERRGEPQPRFFRYALHVLVAAEAIPEGMGRNVVLVRDPARPLHDDNAILMTAHPTDDDGRRLLSLEMLLPRHGVEDASRHLTTARERMLAAVAPVVPFLGRHVLLMDSPHDGRDAQDVAHHRTIAPETPWDRGPATMPVIYGYPAKTALGLGALPVRTPIKRLLLCNEQNVPGLGMEGAFLAAWSTALAVQKGDRRKEWMRRGRFSKIDM